MRLMIATMILAGTVPGAAIAQDAAQTPIAATAASIAPVNGQAMLPVNTEVLLALNSEVNSKKMKEGQKFDLSVSRDVMIGNYIVIPRGTPAHGEITYRTGKGAFGKSAKMEIDLRSITLGGRDVPISGHFRQEGQGNTGATVGAAVAVGVFSAFVTGRSAVFEQGREFRVFTREAVPVAFQATAPVVPVAAPAAAAPAAAPATTPAAAATTGSN